MNRLGQSALEKKSTEKRKEKLSLMRDDFVVEFQNDRFMRPRLGNGRDLSVQGVRFATVVPLKKGERLAMTVYLPKAFEGDRKLCLDAKVVRVYRPKGFVRHRVGCELTHRTATSASTLRHFFSCSKPTWVDPKLAQLV